MCGWGAGSETGGAEFAISRTAGTRVMGGAISLGAVVAHSRLPTAEGRVVAVEVIQFGIHEAILRKRSSQCRTECPMRNSSDKSLHAHGARGAGIEGYVEASTKGDHQCQVPSSHGEDTIQFAGSGGP